MKRAISILVFTLSFLFSFSQTPSVVSRSSDVIVASDGGLFARNTLRPPTFVDTVFANASLFLLDSCGRQIFTYSDNSFWLRACSPKRWVKLLKTGDVADVLVSNGLSKDGDTVELGGTLTESTTISGNSSHGITFSDLTLFNIVNGSGIATSDWSQIIGTQSITLRTHQDAVGIDQIVNIGQTNGLISLATLGTQDASDLEFTIDTVNRFRIIGQLPQSASSGDSVLVRNSSNQIVLRAQSDIAGGGSVAWGSITGTLSDQTDLQNALNAKVNISDTTTMLTNYLNQTGFGIFRSGQFIRADTTRDTGLPSYYYVDSIAGAATGTITGSGANLQLTYWTGASTISGDNGMTVDPVQNKILADSVLAIKLRSDTIHANSQELIADSTAGFGTSITVGTGQSTPFLTLTSNVLNSIPANYGISGASLVVQGVANIWRLPVYSRAKYRWIILEWGVNDINSATDSATFASTYDDYIDTLIINRGWPAARIVILSPTYMNSTTFPTATVAKQLQFRQAAQAIAALKGTKYVDIYSIEAARSPDLLVPDGIHPNDYGASIYVNAITTNTGDSATKNNTLAINGSVDIQRIKWRSSNYASYKSRVLGADSLGNIVPFFKDEIIRNSNIPNFTAQASGINITGTGTFGGYSSTYGRITGVLPSGLTGNSLELGLTGSDGLLGTYNRTTATANNLQINPLGGNVGIATSLSGGERLQVGGGTRQTFGRFNGSISGTLAGLAVEISLIGSVGYIGAFNRTSSAAAPLVFNALGGNVGIVTQVPDRAFHIEPANTATSNAPYAMFRMSAQTSGTGSIGFGPQVEYEIENNSTTMLVAGSHETVWSDATAASEDADFVVDLMAGGAAKAEKFRVGSTGYGRFIGGLFVGSLSNGTGTDSILVINNTEVRKIAPASTTTLYTGDGTIGSNRTITGTSRTMIWDDFTYMVFRGHPGFIFRNTAGNKEYTHFLNSGSVNNYQIGFTHGGVFDIGAAIYIDTLNNLTVGGSATGFPLYSTGKSLYAAEGFSNAKGNFYKVRDITADDDVLISDYFITIDASGGNVTITLPAASSVFGGGVGIQYVFKRLDNSVNTVSIQRNAAPGTDTIDGASSFTLTTQYEVKEVQCISTSAFAIK